jgi:hypothetical protein
MKKQVAIDDGKEDWKENWKEGAKWICIPECKKLKNEREGGVTIFGQVRARWSTRDFVCFVRNPNPKP